MISGTVVSLVVTDRTDNRQLVCHPRQFSAMPGEKDPGQAGLDRLVLSTDFLWCIRLGVEGLVMCRSTIHPDQDACASLSLRQGTACSGRSQGIGKADPEQATKT